MNSIQARLARLERASAAANPANGEHPTEEWQDLIRLATVPELYRLREVVASIGAAVSLGTAHAELTAEFNLTFKDFGTGRPTASGQMADPSTPP